MTRLTLPWPDPALNTHAKGHWYAKASATKAARSAAFSLACEAKVKPDPKAILTFTCHPPDRRRRDVQNMPGMLKASIDGIADAMKCDDHEFRPRFPDSFSEPIKGGCVVVDITAGRSRVVIEGVNDG